MDFRSGFLSVEAARLSLPYDIPPCLPKLGSLRSELSTFQLWMHAESAAKLWTSGVAFLASKPRVSPSPTTSLPAFPNSAASDLNLARFNCGCMQNQPPSYGLQEWLS